MSRHTLSKKCLHFNNNFEIQCEQNCSTFFSFSFALHTVILAQHVFPIRESMQAFQNSRYIILSGMSHVNRIST